MILDRTQSMKKLILLILIFSVILLCGCQRKQETYDITATTLPVFDFTSRLCSGSDLTVGRLVTENVSCLHNYTLDVSQMRMIESSQIVVISGAGLEDFLEDAIVNAKILDASSGVHIHAPHGDHDHDHDHGTEHDHHHAHDPHIWLSVENAAKMAENIYHGLIEAYPEYAALFTQNYEDLVNAFTALQNHGEALLDSLVTRELITFHDGFSYFAEGFDLTIIKAIEEESGSEASAAEIIELIQLVEAHALPAVFTEKSGSDACAGIIAAETNCNVFMLDMAMAGDSYFDAMYHNINTIKEALG